MNGTKAEAAVAGTLISQLSSLIKALEAHELFPSGWGDECPVVQSTAARDVVPKALLLTRVLCTRARSDLNELDLVALEEGGRSTVDEFRAIMDHIATIKSVTEEVKMLWFGVSAGGYLEITYDIKLLSIDWGEEAVGAAKAMALVF